MFSRGEWLHKRFRGRLAAGRRPDFFVWQKALQIILQTAKLLLLPPRTKPQIRKKIGAAEGAAKGQPGCTRGQSLGKSGAAGKGVNSPNLRKNGTANPTKQTFIILKRNHATLKLRPRPPSPPRPPADRTVLEFYFGAPRKLWACNNEPSSSAATRWPFGAERAKLLSFAAQEKPTQEKSTI